LQQVILNLLANAVRFSPEQSTVTVRADTAGDRVAVHVVDHGPGIPGELLARLFVPFDRLGADAGREGGAGLGLVLAKRLTEAMDGTLEVASVVGSGTHVTVTLPAVR
jgi:signal transduction histidine kinase